MRPEQTQLPTKHPPGIASSPARVEAVHHDGCFYAGYLFSTAFSTHSIASALPFPNVLVADALDKLSAGAGATLSCTLH